MIKIDPRNKRFFRLRKKDISQFDKAELSVMIAYCDKMINYVINKKSRRSWIDLKTYLESGQS